MIEYDTKFDVSIVMIRRIKNPEWVSYPVTTLLTRVSFDPLLGSVFAGQFIETRYNGKISAMDRHELRWLGWIVWNRILDNYICPWSMILTLGTCRVVDTKLHLDQLHYLKISQCSSKYLLSYLFFLSPILLSTFADIRNVTIQNPYPVVTAATKLILRPGVRLRLVKKL